MIDSTMIERVARAICRAHGNPDEHFELFMVEARAAIEAMRDPTPEMLTRAGTINNYADDTGTADADHVEWWKGMIDAAAIGDFRGISR